MKKPLVSIICTNYNKGPWIRQAIESFLAQKTDFEFEILLIDDKSTDNSPEILREYVEKFPDKIHLFENDKNLGIVRTWKKICPEARGKYIARCDGDDYWTDDFKLQKQVDFLRDNPKVLWCSTDCDIVDSDGKIIAKNAFENRYLDRADTAEKMLATRGFTNASTWLIDSDTMKKASKKINESAVDDTFNLQLELFSKTELGYIPESMVGYRILKNSDSHFEDLEKIRSRNLRLVETQLEYFGKMKINKVEFVRQLLYQGDKIEILMRERTREVEDRDRLLIEKGEFINKQGEIIQHQKKRIEELEKRIRMGWRYKIMIYIKKRMKGL